MDAKKVNRLLLRPLVVKYQLVRSQLLTLSNLAWFSLFIEPFLKSMD